MESPQPAYPSRNPATFPLEELGHWPILSMNFEWDDAKSEECFRTRGVDFASMIPAFTDPNRLVEIDDRRDYGGTRFQLLGSVSGRAYMIVYTIRGDSYRIISSRHVRPKRAKQDVMTKARIKKDGSVVEVLQDGSERSLSPRIDLGRVDATTEDEIEAQAAQDDAEAKRDAAAYARRVRQRTGLSQAMFAKRIGVPVDSVRNWEQGKRFPRGPARALLRVIDRAPDTALVALDPGSEQSGGE